MTDISRLGCGESPLESIWNMGGQTRTPISQPRSPGQLINLIWNVFVSQNPRDSTIKQRTVVDPEKLIPESFKKIEEPLKLLKTFLTEIW